ncbi:TPA: hypothetical protein ACJIYU_000599 [Yersinia enterocolitica]|nr:hypothetical protein [Yersinia enterocolitica]HDL6705413.1 hypothetical protein [Yersinia enterocolitica]HEN3234650.1 hypothetical protein [Yersinia enterocolitica]HEN3330107.1 hypothetical protein [Yersinia enterocolitica]HEN3408306.1 hypothetical protein [Yersinia enterocolitica]
MAFISNIRFRKHPIFKEVSINFSNDDEVNNSNHYNLIIGENGTGKSELLKEIVRTFRLYKNDVTSVEYMHNFCDATVIRKKGGGKWPEKILASSFSLNDKFPFLSEKDSAKNPYYKYLGIKGASNNAFLGKYKNVFFDSFLKINASTEKCRTFFNVMSSLALPMVFVFKLSASRGYASFFKKMATLESSRLWTDFITNISSKSMSTSRFSSSIMQKILNDENYASLVKKSLFSLNDEFSNDLSVRFDFSSTKGISNKELKRIENIKTLLEAGLISIDDVHLDSYGFFLTQVRGNFI